MAIKFKIILTYIILMKWKKKPYQYSFISWPWMSFVKCVLTEVFVYKCFELFVTWFFLFAWLLWGCIGGARWQGINSLLNFGFSGRWLFIILQASKETAGLNHNSLWSAHRTYGVNAPSQVWLALCI